MAAKAFIVFETDRKNFQVPYMAVAHAERDYELVRNARANDDVSVEVNGACKMTVELQYIVSFALVVQEKVDKLNK
jgi:hypothetical protein